MEGFRHAFQSDGALNERYTHLQEHIKNPLSQSRLEQIRREMAHIYFELVTRDREDALRHKEVDDLQELWDCDE